MSKLPILKRPLILVILFIVILILTVGIDYLFVSSKAARWTKIKTIGLPAIPIDLNQDGIDEFINPVHKEPHFDLRAYRDSGAPIWQCNFSGGSYMSPPYFFNFEYQPFILVFVLYGSDLYMHIIDKEGELVLKEWVAHGQDNDKDGRIHLTGALLCTGDLTGDGRPELALSFTAGYDRLPRGFLVYDFYLRKELWRFESGAAINKGEIIDLDADGRQEVVIGTVAYDNGAEMNGFSDHNSYIIVFDHHGKLIYQQTSGGLFSSCWIQQADIDGNGLNNLVTFVQWRDKANEQNEDLGRLTVWKDNRFEKRVEKRGWFQASSLVFDDIDLDGASEILLSHFNPYQLVVLSGSLDEIFKTTLPSRVRQILPADFTGDGFNEIVVLTNDNVYVYDRSFSLLAMIENVPAAGIYTCQIRDSNAMALGLNDYATNKTHIYTLVEEGYSPGPGLLAGLLGIMIGTLLSFGFRRYYANECETQACLSFCQQAIQALPFAILFFKASGNLLLCNQKGVELFDYSEHDWSGASLEKLKNNNLERALYDAIKKSSTERKTKRHLQRIKSEQGREYKLTVIAYWGKDFINGYWVYLIDTSLQAKSQQAIEWAAWAQRLAHDIKNPLSIIKLTMQQLEILMEDVPFDRDKFRSQIFSVIEETERLRNTADGFMKLLNAQNISKEFYQTKAIIPVVVERITRFLPENITVQCSAEKELDDIEIDLEQFLIVMDNIVANAVAAMPKGGTCSLEIKMIQRFRLEESGLEQNLIVFEFSDTGVGMSIKELDKIFEPFYTKSPNGTGLGLAICKKIIAEHEGELFITSRKGIGTVVRIEIPASKQGGEEQSEL